MSFPYLVKYKVVHSVYLFFIIIIIVIIIYMVIKSKSVGNTDLISSLSLHIVWSLNR